MDRALSEAETALYFIRLSGSADNIIREFCVCNARDPEQFVETLAIESEGGEIYQRWEKRWEGDLLVFKAPDGYVAGAIGWCYDHTRQKGEHADWQTLERELLRNRKSVVVDGLKG